MKSKKLCLWQNQRQQGRGLLFKLQTGKRASWKSWEHRHILPSQLNTIDHCCINGLVSLGEQREHRQPSCQKRNTWQRLSQMDKRVNRRAKNPISWQNVARGLHFINEQDWTYADKLMRVRHLICHMEIWNMIGEEDTRAEYSASPVAFCYVTEIKSTSTLFPVMGCFEELSNQDKNTTHNGTR